MFNKQQINALWDKINSKLGEGVSGGTYEESSIEDIKTKMKEGTLEPGRIYSYETSNGDDKVTVYQQAMTPNEMNTTALLKSDNPKYNNQTLEVDLSADIDTENDFIFILSEDKSKVYVERNGKVIATGYYNGNEKNFRNYVSKGGTKNIIPIVEKKAYYIINDYSTIYTVTQGCGVICRIDFLQNRILVEPLVKNDNDMFYLYTIKDGEFELVPYYNEFGSINPYIENVLVKYLQESGLREKYDTIGVAAYVLFEHDLPDTMFGTIMY